VPFEITVSFCSLSKLKSPIAQCDVSEYPSCSRQIQMCPTLFCLLSDPPLNFFYVVCFKNLHSYFPSGRIGKRRASERLKKDQIQVAFSACGLSPIERSTQSGKPQTGWQVEVLSLSPSFLSLSLSLTHTHTHTHTLRHPPTHKRVTAIFFSTSRFRGREKGESETGLDFLERDKLLSLSPLSAVAAAVHLFC